MSDVIFDVQISSKISHQFNYSQCWLNQGTNINIVNTEVARLCVFSVLFLPKLLNLEPVKAGADGGIPAHQTQQRESRGKPHTILRKNNQQEHFESC